MPFHLSDFLSSVIKGRVEREPYNKSDEFFLQLEESLPIEGVRVKINDYYKSLKYEKVKDEPNYQLFRIVRGNTEEDVEIKIDRVLDDMKYKIQVECSGGII